MRLGRPVARPFTETVSEILANPYLRLMTRHGLSCARSRRSGSACSSTSWPTRDIGGDADALTRFFGTFNFLLGSVSFVVQLFVTSRALRTFGLAVTILTLPLALGFGTALIVHASSVLARARRQCLRPEPALLGRQADLRAALSADSAGPAPARQERDRHRRQPRGRRARRGALRRGDERLLHAARRRARPPRHRRRQRAC